MRHLLRFILVIIAAINCLMLATCKSRPETDETELLAAKESARKRCVAVRGNGQLIMAHFAGMARIIEDFDGVFVGGAGGSSGSISLFIYESIYINPLVCGGKVPCPNPAQGKHNAALLLKSALGYVKAVGDTDEAHAIKFLLELQRKAAENSVIQGDDLAKGRTALLTLLQTDLNLRGIVDPEFIRFLKGLDFQIDPHANESQPNLQILDYRFKKARDMLANFGEFKTDTTDILLMPAVINFEKAMEFVSVIADFYAGYWSGSGPLFKEFINSCAEESIGKSWSETASLKLDEDRTCGDLFKEVFDGFRKTTATKHRYDEEIGKVLDLHIATSVLKGDHATKVVNTAKINYWNGTPASLKDVVFSRDVLFGYWGRPLTNLAVDEKSKRYLNLGEETIGKNRGRWRDALTFSPAEPGLAPIQTIDASKHIYSVGGWPDLAPVPALRAAGCTDIGYITREGGESQFAVGVAKLLNIAKEPELSFKLYDANDLMGMSPPKMPPQKSAYRLSHDDADAVLCTRWDLFASNDILGISENAYRSPLELKTGTEVITGKLAETRESDAIQKDSLKFKCR
jgi:hypothetical protein